jgi:hypothetical protein
MIDWTASQKRTDIPQQIGTCGSWKNLLRLHSLVQICPFIDTRQEMLKTIHLITILYVIILTLLLELPGVPQEFDPVPGPLEEYKHFAAFTLLGFFVELGRTKKPMLFWISMLFLYAVGTEVFQWLLHPICYRYFDWQDIVSDILGVSAGTLIGYFCSPFVKKTSESLDKRDENR